MSKISVIVCFYNAEKYLTRLFESLLQQTYKDYELILVNDGSTDESLFVCKQYESQFANISIINKPNGGLVSARKRGVSVANGEYICCIDADDWVEEDYLETLIKIQNESKADIVVTSHWYDFENEKNKVFGRINPGVYKTEEIVGHMMYDNSFYITGVTQYFHGKLFKSAILKEVQCLVDDRIIVGEDVAVIYPAIAVSKTICISDYCGYHYVKNLGSMVSSVLNDEDYRLNLLVDYIKTYFVNRGLYDSLAYQIQQFYKCSLLTRCIKNFDYDDNLVLSPFGGIEAGKRIVLYGAGILGQQIKHTYVDCGILHMIKWVDRSYDIYRKNGMSVDEPGILATIDNDEYDIVIIAITVEETAEKIVHILNNSYGVSKNKICKLTDEFINAEMNILR